MIYDAISKLKHSRDEAFSLKKMGEYNTFCEVIRLLYISGTDTAMGYAANVDKIIARVKQGHYAHVTQDVKRLCNAAKRTK